MKVKNIAVAAVLACCFSTVAIAELYKVSVTRADQDIYREQGGLVILTRHCFEFVYYEDAVLKYEPGDYSNKLIFKSGTTCDVVNVVRA